MRKVCEGCEKGVRGVCIFFAHLPKNTIKAMSAQLRVSAIYIFYFSKKQFK